MVFPLFRNTGRPIISIGRNQRKAVKLLANKLDGKYELVENPCQCQNPKDGEVVVERDMFGIPNRNILCTNCGLIRSEFVLSDESLDRYYEEDYKPINYNLGEATAEEYYQKQLARGKQFFDLATELNLIESVSSVYDFGCGAGGVMHYFNEAGISCSGNDYSEDYLNYGRKQGMNLVHGQMQDDFPAKGSVDLVIMAHVYEHLKDPLGTLEDIFSRIKVGGYLMFEVPGVFASMKASTGYPGAYHQFAHVINFYHEKYLQDLLSGEGLEIVYSNERCTLVVRKVGEGVQLKFPDANDQYPLIKQHLITSFKSYNTIFNPTFLKRAISRSLR